MVKRKRSIRAYDAFCPDRSRADAWTRDSYKTDKSNLPVNEGVVEKVSNSFRKFQEAVALAKQRPQPRKHEEKAESSKPNPKSGKPLPQPPQKKQQKPAPQKQKPQPLSEAKVPSASRASDHSEDKAPSAASSPEAPEAPADGSKPARPKELRNAFTAKSERRKPATPQLKTERRPGESFYAFSKRLREEAHVALKELPVFKKVNEKKKQKLAERALKRKKRGADSDEDGEVDFAKAEHVPFGEVAQQPPRLQSVPKRKKVTTVTQISSAEHDLKEDRDAEAADGAEGLDDSEDEKEAEERRRAEIKQKMEQRSLDIMRERAILAYKNAKKQRRKNPDRPELGSLKFPTIAPAVMPE